MSEIPEYVLQKTWIQANKNSNKIAQSRQENEPQIRAAWNRNVTSWSTEQSVSNNELLTASGLGDYLNNDGLPPPGNKHYMRQTPWK